MTHRKSRLQDGYIEPQPAKVNSLIVRQKAKKEIMDELSQIYGPDTTVKETYGIVPGSILLPHLARISEDLNYSESETEILTAKVTQYCRRLYMMHLAGEKAVRREAKFISRQDHEAPILSWNDETEIFYHVATMHIFARCALDSMAHIATATLLDDKGWDVPDRFFEFSRRIREIDDPIFNSLKDALKHQDGEEWSWFNLLCGTEQGRSLREQCSFQKIARIEYHENRPEDERDCIYAVIKSIDRGKISFMRIPLLTLVYTVRNGVMKFAITLEEILDRKFRQSEING